MRTPEEPTSVGLLSFAEAQELLFRLDSVLPIWNGAGSSLAARAKHAAQLADSLAEAQAELSVLRYFLSHHCRGAIQLLATADRVQLCMCVCRCEEHVYLCVLYICWHFFHYNLVDLLLIASY